MKNENSGFGSTHCDVCLGSEWEKRGMTWAALATSPSSPQLSRGRVHAAQNSTARRTKRQAEKQTEQQTDRRPDRQHSGGRQTTIKPKLPPAWPKLHRRLGQAPTIDKVRRKMTGDDRERGSGILRLSFSCVCFSCVCFSFSLPLFLSRSFIPFFFWVRSGAFLFI